MDWQAHRASEEVLAPISMRGGQARGIVRPGGAGSAGSLVHAHDVLQESAKGVHMLSMYAETPEARDSPFRGPQEGSAGWRETEEGGEGLRTAKELSGATGEWVRGRVFCSIL